MTIFPPVLCGLLLAAPLPLAPLAAQAPPPTPLSLGEAVRQSLDAAPVRIADASLRQAEARHRGARGALLPSLSGAASYVNRTYNIHTFGLEFPTAPGAEPFPDLVGPFGVGDARATLHQPLLDPSALARARSAGGAVTVSGAERAVAAEAAAEAAATAYLHAVRASAIVAARGADVELADQLAALARAQLAAGVSPGIDVTRAETQLTSARGLLLMARNEAVRAAIGLARAMGLEPDRRFLLTDSLSGALARSDAPGDRAAALQAARARRPDLTLERARVARAGLERSAIKAERLPSLDLEADAGFSGSPTRHGLTTRQLALEVRVPFFDGLRREARIAEQDAVLDAAAEREHDTDLQLAADVEGAFLDLESATEQERVAQDGLRLAETEVAEARDRFQSGIAGNIDVISAQSSLGRARDVLIEARAAGAAARIRLARATGVAASIH